MNKNNLLIAFYELQNNLKEFIKAHKTARNSAWIDELYVKLENSYDNYFNLLLGENKNETL